MNAKRSKRSADEVGSTQSFGEMPRPSANDEGGGESSSTLGSDVRQTAKNAGHAIREQASALGSDISQELSGRVEDQKRRGLESVRSFADAVDTAAQQLEQQSPQMARYVRDAAAGLQSLTNNIENRSVNDLLRSATDLARSKPALFMVGAVAAGFTLARFMKSSATSEGASAHPEGWSSGEMIDENSAGHFADEGDTVYGNP